MSKSKVVPAYPGHVMLKVCTVKRDDGTSEVATYKRPIIAWRVTEFEFPHENPEPEPIAVGHDGWVSLDDAYIAIRLPDGRVIPSPYMGYDELENEEEFMTICLREFARAKAKKSA